MQGQRGGALRLSEINARSDCGRSSENPHRRPAALEFPVVKLKTRCCSDSAYPANNPHKARSRVIVAGVARKPALPTQRRDTSEPSCGHTQPCAQSQKRSGPASSNHGSKRSPSVLSPACPCQFLVPGHQASCPAPATIPNNWSSELPLTLTTGENSNGTFGEITSGDYTANSVVVPCR